MKYSNINVEFKKPENELKEQLQRNGARNIDIRRSYNGELEVRYSIKCGDPEKEIQNVLSQTGAKDIRSSSNYNGARFDYKLDDMIDEREFKRKLQELLRRNGYRSN